METKEMLKKYILKQRQRMKKEQLMSMELQRVRKEEELKRKSMKMTLEELLKEMQKLEHRLSELKAEKHSLFSQLKKVLNEDEMRRRQRETEQHNNNNHNNMTSQHSQQQFAQTTVVSQQPQFVVHNQFPLPFVREQQHRQQHSQHFHKQFTQQQPQQQQMNKDINRTVVQQNSGRKRPHELMGQSVVSSGQSPAAGQQQSPPTFATPTTAQSYKSAVTYTPSMKMDFSQFGQMHAQSQQLMQSQNQSNNNNNNNNNVYNIFRQKNIYQNF